MKAVRGRGRRRRAAQSAASDARASGEAKFGKLVVSEIAQVAHPAEPLRASTLGAASDAGGLLLVDLGGVDDLVAQPVERQVEGDPAARRTGVRGARVRKSATKASSQRSSPPTLQRPKEPLRLAAGTRSIALETRSSALIERQALQRGEPVDLEQRQRAGCSCWCSRKPSGRAPSGSPERRARRGRDRDRRPGAGARHEIRHQIGQTVRAPPLAGIGRTTARDRVGGGLHAHGEVLHRADAVRAADANVELGAAETGGGDQDRELRLGSRSWRVKGRVASAATGRAATSRSTV